jgi:hypothetical protein
VVAGVRCRDIDVMKTTMLEAYDELQILHAELYLCLCLCKKIILVYPVL